MKKKYPPSFFRKIDRLDQFSWHWIPSKGKSGGILGGVKSCTFNITGTSQGDFHIKIQLFDTKLLLSWALIFIYGAAQEEHKQEFLIELAAVCSDQTIPILIGGDFNLLSSFQEKKK